LNKEQINKIFTDFNKLTALIIGDVMVDCYYRGCVNRISPEAPVPIVSVEKTEYRPGGAANVALNIQALGAESILCSVMGNDDNASVFESLLKKNGLTAEGIIRDENRITTVKTRVIGNNHQMLRIDFETETSCAERITVELIGKITSLIEKRKIDVIIFEDYDKGVITPLLIQQITALASEKKIPVAVDPKKKNFLDYKNVTLIKPNLKELREGLKIEINAHNDDELFNASGLLKETLNARIALLTLSERGILISDKDMNKILPAHIRQIADVSGAGDTVISVAALCLALNVSSETMALISNLAGGLVCESVGVVPVNKERLLKETINTLF
jgi:D-glycero-beta-D-manno-heptose-7-phosphate kinase